MKNKTSVFITEAVTLIPAFIGLALWNKLPQEIAIHFDASFNADNWCYKGYAVLGRPLFMFVAQLFCLFMTSYDPKKKNINDKMYNIVMWICPVCSVIYSIIIYMNALNIYFSVFSILQVALGIGVTIIGNYLPKSRQNYTIGIKLPWTLSDKENWNSTHRFSGRMWIVGGLILIANSFFNNSILHFIVLTLIIITPLIYSWIYYVRHKNISS